MTNQKDRGPLVAVIAPDVEGVDQHRFTASKKYAVEDWWVDGGLEHPIIADDDGEETWILLKNCKELGADWIPIHANDVIQGFGEYRTRGGEYVYIDAYNAGGEGIPLWSEVGKAGKNLTPRAWTSAGEMRPPGPPAYPRETPDDITGPWEEAGEPDYLKRARKQLEDGTAERLETVDRHLLEAPQEIPAAEAIKRLLDGEVLERFWAREWVKWRWRGEYLEYFECNRWNTYALSLAALVKTKWRIPTPETFGKEEAAERLMNDEVLHPIGWDHRENVRFRKRIMQVVNTRTGTPWAWAAFPDDQLFVEVG